MDAHAHAHSGPQSPVKTKPGSANVNMGHCYGHSFSRLVSSLPVATQRSERYSAGTAPVLCSYIKSCEYSFSMHLCDHAIIMQAVECDLCPRFLSLALLFLSFTASLFYCLAPCSWSAAACFERFFCLLTIIFRQAAVTSLYCTGYCQQSKSMDKHNMRNGCLER